MVAIVLPAVFVVAQVASAASWTEQFPASPSGATGWQSGGVSCLPGGYCMEVGSQTDPSSDNHVLAEQRQGSTWSLTSTAELEGTVSSEFNAVSCPSTVNCTAVGDYDNGSSQLPLAEAWDGSYWSIDVTPAPAGAVTSTLQSVSCPSATSCIAVGAYSGSSDGSGEQMFAATLSGYHWTLLTPIVPAGTVQSDLEGISCTSPVHCTAVGYYSTGSGALTLAETWNGSTWTVQPTPNDTADAQLDGISCTSATACTAVGVGAMALRWNGTAWSQQTFTKPGRGTVPDLTAVSCVSASICYGVGDYYIEGVANAGAEVWNGTTWKFQQVPIGTSSDTAYLAGVSCAYPGACTAVGAYQDPVDGYRSLVETITTGWQRQAISVPSGAVSSYLSDVSCPSATACMAVASYIGSTPGLVGFTESWNGTSWTSETIPNPTTGELWAVSCTSAKACTAVGAATPDNQVEPLAERWNGTSWTVQSVPTPPGKTAADLSDVSCASPVSCVAAGTATDASNDAESFSAAWNGTSWTVQVMPTRSPDTYDAINSVSCTSATACIAVGEGGSGTLSEAWNGTKWTIHAAVDPAGATNAVLNGVSCRSASSCLAVGSYDDGSTQVTLSEFWNGAGWTLHATPPLPNATASELQNVSCTQAGPCTAVGELTKSGHKQPSALAEQWDGTKWGVQATVSPAGSNGGELTGVSCLSGIDCTAVGYYRQSHLTALAEQYS